MPIAYARHCREYAMNGSTFHADPSEYLRSTFAIYVCSCRAAELIQQGVL